MKRLKLLRRQKHLLLFVFYLNRIISTHSFRHSFYTNMMLSSKTSLKKVSFLVGLSSKSAISLSYLFFNIDKTISNERFLYVDYYISRA